MTELEGSAQALLNPAAGGRRRGAAAEKPLEHFKMEASGIPSVKTHF